MMTTMLHAPAFRGAVAGLLSAAAVDYHAFTKWQSLEDVANYQWSTALFRWLSGAIVGAVTSSSLGAIFS